MGNPECKHRVLQMVSDCVRRVTSGLITSFVHNKRISNGPTPFPYFAEIFMNDFENKILNDSFYTRNLVLGNE